MHFTWQLRELILNCLHLWRGIAPVKLISALNLIVVTIPLTVELEVYPGGRFLILVCSVVLALRVPGAGESLLFGSESDFLRVSSLLSWFHVHELALLLSRVLNLHEMFPSCFYIRLLAIGYNPPLLGLLQRVLVTLCSILALTLDVLLQN